MKRMLINGVVFLLLFSASAGGSWYYSQMNKPQTDVAEEPADGEEFSGQKIAESIYRADELQQIYRPKDLGPETILSLSRQLEEREQALIEREAALKRQNYQANMLLEDTQREQQELSSFHAKLENEIGRAQNILQEISSKQNELSATQQSMEEAMKIAKTEVQAVDEAEMTQLNQIAKYYADMPEETAASLLKQLCDGGKLEDAAKVVGAIEQKTATKILVALNDDELVNQLLQKVKVLPRADKSKMQSRRN